MTSRTLALTLLTTCVLVLAACGDDEPAVGPNTTAATTQTDPQTPAAAGSSAAMSCPDVPVPGHLAENVKAAGLDCEATVPIANEAEGRGRAPYRSSGFDCEPTDADGGKTNYTCTMGEAKMTFLYG